MKLAQLLVERVFLE